MGLEWLLLQPDSEYILMSVQEASLASSCNETADWLLWVQENAADFILHVHSVDHLKLWLITKTTQAAAVTCIVFLITLWNDSQSRVDGWHSCCHGIAGVPKIAHHLLCCVQCQLQPVKVFNSPDNL